MCENEKKKEKRMELKAISESELDSERRFVETENGNGKRELESGKKVISIVVDANRPCLSFTISMTREGGW